MDRFIQRRATSASGSANKPEFTTHGVVKPNRSKTRGFPRQLASAILTIVAAVGAIGLYYKARPIEGTRSLGHKGRGTDSQPNWTNEKILACMPTVRRPNDTEYITAAVESWRAHTEGSQVMGRLAVFNMESDPATHKVVARLRDRLGSRNGRWLSVHNRLDGRRPSPRKLTHGDPLERVLWRSKEALDYSETLQRCFSLASLEAAYALILQDDVVFTPEINSTDAWVEKELIVKKSKWCTASLFDFAPGPDLGILANSNMVARIWRRDVAARFVQYARDNFDESPVDWLADRFCKKYGLGKTFVRKPNPVRHRGRVSSFAGNKREGLLT